MSDSKVTIGRQTRLLSTF